MFITIRLIRKNAACDSDDWIQLSPEVYNNVLVEYTNGESRDKHAFVDHKSKVVEYVTMVLKNMVSEVVDPFESVQLDTSCFPTLLYNVAELKPTSVYCKFDQKFDQIMRTVEMELQRW